MFLTIDSPDQNDLGIQIVLILISGSSPHDRNEEVQILKTVYWIFPMTKNAKEMFEYIETNSNLPKDQIIAGVTELLEKCYEKLSDQEKQRIGNKYNYAFYL